ncbi:MAG: hypothetical protein ACPL7D_00880 [Candidatus Sumerlaeaceae bacterium]
MSEKRGRNFLLSALPAYAIIGFATLALFAPSLPYLATDYLGSSACDMNIAYRHFLAFGTRCLSQGTIPQWNPYIFCGTSFLPSTCATLHQPLNAALLLLLPLPLAANLIIICHIILFGIGVCRWGSQLGLERWTSVLAGILAVASSAVVARVFAGHLTLLCTFAWAPWLLGAVQASVRLSGRGWPLIGLFAAFVILGGHLQVAYYAFLFSAIVAAATLFETPQPIREKCQVAKYVLRYLIAGGVLGATLAAIELMPVLDVLRYSARVTAPDKTWVRRFSLPYENLLTLAYPNLWGETLNYMGRWFWWEASPVCGVGVLSLAVVGLFWKANRRRFLVVPATIFVFGTMLAMATDLPALDSLVCRIPGWTALRGHAKIFAFSLLVLPLLAARGVEALLIRDKWALRAAIGVCGVLALGGLFFLSGLADTVILSYLSAGKTLNDRLFGLSPYAVEGQKLALSSAHRAGLHTLITSCLIALLVLAGTGKRLAPKFAAPLLASLAVGELVTLSLPVANNHFRPQEITELRELAENFEQTNKSARVETPPEGLVNAAMTYGLLTTGGNDINIHRFYNTFLNAVDGKVSSEPHLHVRVDRDSPLWDFAALRFVVIPTDQTLRAELGLQKAFSLGRFTVWQRPSSLPYAWTAHNVIWVEDDETKIMEKLVTMASSHSRDVLLVGSPSQPSPVTSSPLKALSSRRISQTEIALAIDSPGIVFVAEGYSPHWKAYDAAGNLLPLYRANSAFMAVSVPKATKVVLRYDNPWFLCGRILSAFALIVFVATLIYDSRRHRPKVNFFAVERV